MIDFWRAVAVTAAVVGTVAGANAQSMRDMPTPAEIPPASYTGKQYVDSRGCIFIRAGFGGNVQWVPRVARNRTVLCGATPTQVAGAVPLNPPAGTPKETTAKVASTRVVTPRVTPKKTPVVLANRIPAAKEEPRVLRIDPVVVANPVIRQPRVVNPVINPVRGVDVAMCNTGGTPRPIVNQGRPVRCGPQAIHPSDMVRGVRNGRLNDGTYPVAEAAPVIIPEGYRPVWEDGRLNPHRGIGTLDGAIQTSLVWTNTVPRRLVDRASGEDVTLKYAYLKYPYVNYADQVAALKAAGAEFETVVVGGVQQTAVRAKAPKKETVKKKANVVTSTKTPPAKSVAKASYVQAGMFGNKASADAAIAAIRAMGLPVKVGATTYKGQPVQIVVAGPFAGKTGLNAIVSQLKSAGFRTAKIRK